MTRSYKVACDGPIGWIACEQPERPPAPGIRFHLREEDNCRACAIAWLTARNHAPNTDVATLEVLDSRATRILAGQR